MVYAMMIETARCLGCSICLKACKDEFSGNEYLPYSMAQPNANYGYGPKKTFGWPATPSRVQPWASSGQLWMQVHEQTCGTYPNVGVRYLPMPCMHCRTAACVDAADDGAVLRRPDGIVLIDPLAARGQRHLVDACPYGCIAWNDEVGVPQKCTFCVHLLRQGELPRCVEACPLKVITFGDLEDPASDVSKKVAALEAGPLHPEYGTEPRVYYDL